MPASLRQAPARSTAYSRAVFRRAAATLLLCAAGAAAAVEPERPNVVLILVDDGGFMDFGGYGGEAHTPTLDALGDAGIRFSRYHTSPLCSPSRAMLLTGMDNHLTGVATIPEVIVPSQEGRPGYTLTFEDGVETVAGKLQAAGYRTYMTGKWHLGEQRDELPQAHGFDRSFALAASGADNWEQKSYMPYYATADWYEDGEPARLPDGFYSSEFHVDRMMEYIEADASSGRPFFAYLAFQAVHIPIQAPRQFTDNYDGVYADGWHELRRQRWQRARQLGLIPEDAPLADVPEGLRAWDDLAADERALYERSMQVNAGMLEAMDHHIARLVDWLEERGELERTLFVITSDNGPEFGEVAGQPGMGAWMAVNGYHRELETLGEHGSLTAIGPEWATAAAAPGALFKFFAAEGGIRVPLIVSGPGVHRRGFVHAFAFVTDVAPTILDLAGVDPDIAGRGKPMTGRSLRPLLDGSAEAVYGPDESVGMEVSGNAALFKGDYKLTRSTAPYGEGRWQLFDVASDPGETRDLFDSRPELARELLADYQRYAARVGVIPPPEGFNILRQVARNTVARLAARYWPWLAATGLVLLLAIAWPVARRLRK